jgi:4-carboxymuconolactone decarboxylase
MRSELPPVLTPEQQDAAEQFRKLRGVDPFGPFIPLLSSPELMTRVSALGEYLRFRSALPPRLSELAIVITAAHWRQQYEWDVHAPIALQAGIPQSVLDAIWKGESPDDLDAAQQAMHDLCVGGASRSHGVSCLARSRRRGPG